MTSVADIAQNMQAKFNSAAAAGLDLVFGFNIEDGENFFLTVKDGTCEMSQGESANANVTLIMNTETLSGIIDPQLLQSLGQDPASHPGASSSGDRVFVGQLAHWLRRHHRTSERPTKHDG